MRTKIPVRMKRTPEAPSKYALTLSLEPVHWICFMPQMPIMRATKERAIATHMSARAASRTGGRAKMEL